MAHSAFIDKSKPPTEDVIHQTLGPALRLWRELISALEKDYVCEQDLKYLYGKKYGWALRFRYKKKLLANLYPAQEHVVVQVNLGPEAVERALSMGLGAMACEAIARAYPYSEGRWVFVPVRSAGGVDDVLRLIALRATDQRIPARQP